MSWLYLVLAGISELGWPLGFKMSAMAQAQNNTMHTVLWLGLALLSMVTSMAFLYLAQRHIHMGTAYIVWTGIGGMGTALVGIFFFQEPATLIRLLSLIAILALLDNKKIPFSKRSRKGIVFIAHARICATEVIRDTNRLVPSRS